MNSRRAKLKPQAGILGMQGKANEFGGEDQMELDRIMIRFGDCAVSKNDRIVGRGSESRNDTIETKMVEMESDSPCTLSKEGPDVDFASIDERDSGEA